MATTYNLSQVSSPDASILATGDIINCPYTGGYKTITLPKGKYKLEVWGAQGGSYQSYYGGYGGYSYGELELTENTTLYLYAGGQPASSTATTTPAGWNGGGTGCCRTWDYTTYGQGGGGGSDIRIASTSLSARVIVAGGGGGSASVNAATTKYGGGTSGGSPNSTYAGQSTSAGSGGSFGQGGSASSDGTNYNYGSGGGGGGWYGGGAYTSYTDTDSATRGYNGGGSGYIHTSTTAQSACILSSQYYLTNAKTIAGNQSITDYSGSTTTGHSGNGAVRITVLNITPPKGVFIKTNSTTWNKAKSIFIKIDANTWIEKSF